MPKKILIVDDEELVRKTLGFILRDEYELDFAGSGLEGYQKAAQNEYDLVIMDLKMPDINGIDVIKKICQKKPDFRAAVITGYYQQYRDALEEIKGQVIKVFLKPLEMDAFKKDIREIFSGASLGN